LGPFQRSPASRSLTSSRRDRSSIFFQLSETAHQQPVSCGLQSSLYRNQGHVQGKAKVRVTFPVLFQLQERTHRLQQPLRRRLACVVHELILPVLVDDVHSMSRSEQEQIP